MDIWNYICVFRNGDAAQQWKWFLYKHASIFWTHTI